MHQLLQNDTFLTSFIITLIGSGGISGWIASIAARRKSNAEAEGLAAQAAREAMDILTCSVIQPLREQLDVQEKQIRHLERQQNKLFSATAYIRSQNHWLEEFCSSGLLPTGWSNEHPKPKLPDMLREEIAPETLPINEEGE